MVPLLPKYRVIEAEELLCEKGRYKSLQWKSGMTELAKPQDGQNDRTACLHVRKS